MISSNLSFFCHCCLWHHFVWKPLMCVYLTVVCNLNKIQLLFVILKKIVFFWILQVRDLKIYEYIYYLFIVVRIDYMRSTPNKILSVQYSIVNYRYNVVQKISYSSFITETLKPLKNFSLHPISYQSLATTFYLLSSFSEWINLPCLVKPQDLAIFLNVVTPQNSGPISNSACLEKITSDNAT